MKMFIRNLWYRIQDKVNSFWYFQISTRLFPCHNSIRKAVPRYWTDSDYLIEEVCFQVLIDFWEPQGENGEAHLRFQFASKQSTGSLLKRNRENYKRSYIALKSAYEWAKIRKAKHENAVSFEEMTSLRNLDTKHLLSIIRYRGVLWT